MDTHAAADKLIQEVVALHHRLKTAAQELHGGADNAAGKRGVVLTLTKGPMTVPDMARLKGVSRQHVQVLVNELISEGRVELVDNPNHCRSKLVRLTDGGRRWVGEIQRRERGMSRVIWSGLDIGEMTAAAECLAKIRSAFDSPQWQAVVGESTVSGGAQGNAAE